MEMYANVWRPTDITQQPEVILKHWKVVQLPDGDRHFIGYEPQAYQGRVSSKIVEFDKATLTGKTRSGRVYKLSGEPGYHDDAAYVWNWWKEINKVEDFIDISLAL